MNPMIMGQTQPPFAEWQSEFISYLVGTYTTYISPTASVFVFPKLALLGGAFPSNRAKRLPSFEALLYSKVY